MLTTYAYSMNGCYQTYNRNHVLKGTTKIQRLPFQGQNFISWKELRGVFTFVVIEA